MPLSPEEQAEYEALKGELSVSSYGGLSPEEMMEAQTLQEELGEEGFFTNIKSDFEKRGKQAQAAEQRLESGEIGYPQFAIQKYGQAGIGAIGDVAGNVIGEGIDVLQKGDELLGGYGGRALSGAGQTISSIPTSMSGDTFGSDLDLALTDYSKWAQENPSSAATLEGVFNIGTLGAPAVKKTPSLFKNIKKGGQAFKQKNINRLTAADLKEEAGLLYQKADELGATVKPDFWSDYTQNVVKSLNKDASQEAVESAFDVKDRIKPYLQNLNEVSDNIGSFSAIKKTDEILNSLYYEADRAGKSLEAEDLLTMRNTLRDMVDSASPDYFEGGAEAFEVAKNARKVYAASRRMDDVEKVMQKSIGAQQPSTVLKNGFRKIRDGKNFKFYSPEEQFAIKKAAKDGSMQSFLKLQGSGLGPVVSGSVGLVTGGPLAGGALAAGSFAMRETAKSAAEGIQNRKSRDVLSAIQATSQGIPAPRMTPYVTGAAKDVGAITAPLGAAQAIQNETLEQRAKRLFGSNK